MRYAIYRVLYGEDFIVPSIQSISPYVDKVIVFYTQRAFGGASSVIYKNESILFPQPIDGVLGKILNMQMDKVIVQHHYAPDPHSQITTLVNDQILQTFKRPDTIIFMEHDHIWKRNQIESALVEFESGNIACASSRQIELWKNDSYRIPERHKRVGSVFWNLNKIDRLPETRPNGVGAGFSFLSSHVHNYGFCMSRTNMLWKHLLAMGFSQRIGDTVPKENWYEEVWSKWHPIDNNVNLDISIGYEDQIPHIVPYDRHECPETALNIAFNN